MKKVPVVKIATPDAAAELVGLPLAATDLAASVDEGDGAVLLPTSFTALVDGRLEALKPAERRVLQAAALPDAEITLFDARPLDKDVSGDPRTLALSLGSVQLLERLGAWRPEIAQAISEVHVSQDAPSLLGALSEVSPKQRGVVLLAVVRDRPYADVAAALDIPVGTVKSRVHHALRGMRRTLDRTELAA